MSEHSRHFKRIALDTTDARRTYEIPGAGNFLAVIRQSSGLGLQIRLDSNTSEPIETDEFGSFEVPGGFSRIFVSHAAVPGGELVLGIGAGIYLRPGPIRGVTVGTVDQGVPGAFAWGVSDALVRTALGAPADAAAAGVGVAGSVLAVLKRIRDLWESFAFRSGNPVVSSLALAVAGTTYGFGPAVVLGRNARRGVVRAAATNAGTVEIRLSHDGATFSGWFGPILAGEAFTLDGFDVHTVNARSTVAGDSVTLIAI